MRTPDQMRETRIHLKITLNDNLGLLCVARNLVLMALIDFLVFLRELLMHRRTRGAIKRA